MSELSFEEEVDEEILTPDDFDDLGELDWSGLNLEDYDIDLLPFILRLYIVEKNLGMTKLEDIIHPAQVTLIRKVNECINTGRPTRIIVLKARQIGISTIIEALAFTLAFLMNRMRAMIVAHEMGSSEHLLSMSQNYFDEFDFKEFYTQKNKSAKILSWVETKSQMSISTAKNTGSGRSRTIQFLHGSEVGFWDNAELLMTGLAQAVTDFFLSFIFMESTANGIGNYFQLEWDKACRGETDFIPMFFPWYTHPEYLASRMGLPFITGTLDAEELKLVAIMRDPPRERWNDYTATPLSDQEIWDRLSWRRWMIPNKCNSDLNKFHQEYPTTPEEAFISTGTNIYPLERLDKVMEFSNGLRGEILREGAKTRFQQFNDGKLKIFKTPVAGSDYIIAGDPKRAAEGDYACAQVLNRRTWEQVAVYRDKVDPVTFGEIMMNLGMYYNTALLVPENQGGGYATVAVLLDRNYPFVWQHEKAETMPGQIDKWFGWDTNWKTKSQAIATLKKVVVDGLIKLHDRETYEELKNYVALPGGKYGNAKGLVDYDDMVMALAIAMTVTWYTMHELTMGGGGTGGYTPPSPNIRIVPTEPPLFGKANQTTTIEKVDEMADVPEVPPWESWGTK